MSPVRLALALSASVACSFASACTEPEVPLGALRSSSTDASTLVVDDDDASASERHDDFDDVTPSPGSHECTEYEPVCGTDGKTYRNRCDSAEVGVKVASQGTCP